EETNESERIEWLLQQTGGRGADVTIEATGAPIAGGQGMRYTRDAGRVVIVGQYTDHGPLTTEAGFNPHADLNKKHLDVLGCWGSDYAHFHRAALLARDARLFAPWLALEVAAFPLARVNDALAAVARGDVVKALLRP